MVKLVGIVSGLTRESLVFGEYGQHLLHEAKFVVGDGTPVRVRADEPPPIEEGDLVAVSGVPFGEHLRVQAWRNLSRHTRGNVGKWTHTVGGLISLVVAALSEQATVKVLFALSALAAWVWVALIVAAEVELDNNDNVASPHG